MCQQIVSVDIDSTNPLVHWVYLNNSLLCNFLKSREIAVSLIFSLISDYVVLSPGLLCYSIRHCVYLLWIGADRYSNIDDSRLLLFGPAKRNIYMAYVLKSPPLGTKPSESATSWNITSLYSKHHAALKGGISSAIHFTCAGKATSGKTSLFDRVEVWLWRQSRRDLLVFSWSASADNWTGSELMPTLHMKT